MKTEELTICKGVFTKVGWRLDVMPAVLWLLLIYVSLFPTMWKKGTFWYC